MADELGLTSDGGRGGESLITQVLGGVDGFFVELGQEDVGDGANHILGSAFKQVGEADVKLSFAQTDGGIERGKAAEAQVNGRHGRPGAQSPVLLLKDGDKIGADHDSLQFTGRGQR